jgi:hypothetical protein
MSDRLKFFRKLMSAFEGTSNPQRAVERGFYVNLPNNPVGAITRRIELRPSSVHLVFGGIGSGKTTQLLLTQQALNELEDIKAIYVDVSLVTDISDLKSGALIAIAGLELIKILGNIEEVEIQNSRKIIQDLAYGFNHVKHIFPNSKETHNVIEKIEKVVTHHAGILSDEKQRVRRNATQAFHVLSNAVKQKFDKEIIFLFDGLDRLSNSQIFIDFAVNDVIAINKVGVGAVIVGSISTAYKERENIEQLLGDSYFLPYLDTVESIESRQFFYDILEVRDPNHLIVSDARNLLAYNSGGVLRDLMSLCQAAIEEAYINGFEQVTVENANQAIMSFAHSKIMGMKFPESNINILREKVKDKSFFPRTSEDFDLLLAGYILEYRYPNRRFAVHPVLTAIIEAMNKLSMYNA